jgi:DNA (cytosine-5)-methyltransferase 1
MNYLDLFSGIGGFHKGLEEAGFKFNWTGHSEIDKYAKSIYQNHFKESEDLGDVSNINVQDLPEIDLISFGFPCQDLSIAGKRGGLQASRSGLFYQATRIIKAKRPSYFIFENVKGLFSSNGGLDWLNVLREIANIGYDGQWQLLNTRWFLPQNRERVYFVGYPRERSGQQIFPIGQSDIWSGESQGEAQGEGQRFRGNYPCIDTRTGSTARGQHLISIFNKNQGPVANCMSARYYKDGSENLIAGPMSRVRKLIPKECERLQGFPANWTKYGKDEELISDTQRYKTLGNAVSVPVVKAVGEVIYQMV